MNSGIRDAHNLAWKLAAVVHGRLGEGLLASYEQERRRHVQEMILLALRMGRIMAPQSRLAGALTRLTFHALNAWPPVRDYFAQMKYKPQPRFAGGFQSPDHIGLRQTLVGRLMPQFRVTTRSGEQVLLDDLLGEGFALVSTTDDLGRFEAATQHEVWRRLGVSRLAIRRRNGDDGGVPSIVAVEGAPRFKGYGDVKDLVLLVRPDRYVAAAFPLAEADAHAARLAALCAQTWLADEAPAPEHAKPEPVGAMGQGRPAG